MQLQQPPGSPIRLGTSEVEIKKMSQNAVEACIMEDPGEQGQVNEQTWRMQAR